MNDLFGEEQDDTQRSAGPVVDDQAPLAERMRPRSLDEFLGQESTRASDSFLRWAIEQDQVPSMILWGPPGCGKTSLAHVIAHQTCCSFESFSAVLGGIGDVRTIVDRAKKRKRHGQKTVLFVDEIHRFNKAQQDAFLPHVEAGTVTLVGATTENPSFALNDALLSRCRVVILDPLSVEAIQAIVKSALNDHDRGLGTWELETEVELVEDLALLADGDGRRALNLLEQVAIHGRGTQRRKLQRGLLKEVLGNVPLRHDRAGDQHYDLVSAFIKSLRGSHPDAALYYAARMILVGEDPRFLFRRLIIFASEDVGNADPRALELSLAAALTFERVGMPEGRLALAQAITYCATAPKSNASYKAWDLAMEDARNHGSLEIPVHLRNAPTKLMKELGYGKDYQYPHDHDGHFVTEEYLPDALRGRRYYQPGTQGYEQRIRERLEHWWDSIGVDRVQTDPTETS
jgi:putative ATPase